MKADDSVERAMDRRGNLNYAFVDPSRLDPQSSDAVRRLSSVIPRRFFPAT
jgi:hypothetical protein